METAKQYIERIPWFAGSINRKVSCCVSISETNHITQIQLPLDRIISLFYGYGVRPTVLLPVFIWREVWSARGVHPSMDVPAERVLIMFVAPNKLIKSLHYFENIRRSAICTYSQIKTDDAHNYILDSVLYGAAYKLNAYRTFDFSAEPNM